VANKIGSAIATTARVVGRFAKDLYNYDWQGKQSSSTVSFTPSRRTSFAGSTNKIGPAGTHPSHYADSASLHDLFINIQEEETLRDKMRREMIVAKSLVDRAASKHYILQTSDSEGNWLYAKNIVADFTRLLNDQDDWINTLKNRLHSAQGKIIFFGRSMYVMLTCPLKQLWQTDPATSSLGILSSITIMISQSPNQLTSPHKFLPKIRCTAISLVSTDMENVLMLNSAWQYALTNFESTRLNLYAR